MLVGAAEAARRTAGWRLGALVSLAVLVLCVLSLVPYLRSSTETVRLRNALLLHDAQTPWVDWTPRHTPAHFVLERGQPDPLFAEVASRLDLAGMDSDWARVIAISRHLLSNPHRVGTPVQSNLRDTHHAIIHDGTGYCGDFTRVFMALAITAGIPVRAWSFSFDGFGGHGHTWPEIWNRQLSQWQLIDVFDNYYFAGPDGVPLSALALRRAMVESPDALHLRALDPAAAPGYAVEAKAWDYFRRGLPEWYVSDGNNVFTYEQAFLVRKLSGISRAAEQLGGIAQGVYPPIRIIADAGNQTQFAALIRLRQHLVLVAWAGCTAAIALILCLAGWWRVRRKAPGVTV